MLTRSDGGGAGNGAAGGDGLVNPAGLIAKSADLDTTAITGAAEAIRSMGDTVDTQTDAIKTEWSTKLPGCYEAPEQSLVYALMTDPATASETLKKTFHAMAGYLDTYATELGTIKPELSDWETRAQAFRDDVIGGVWVDARESKDANAWTYLKEGAKDLVGADNERKLVPWYEDGDTIEKNNTFLTEIAGIYAQVSTAASTCATSINGLTSLPADKKEIPPIPKEAFTNPESPMPWGNPRGEERNCPESVGHGAYQFGKSTLEGLGSLISYNPETGDWGDWGHAGQAWMGTGNLLLSLAVTTNPFAQALNAALKANGNGDSQMSKWIDERNTMTATVASSIVGIDLNAKDVFHKWKEDGVATFTESFLNVGTMFIPGAGQVGAGLKAASIGARVAKIAGAVADFAVPGGSFLVKGGIHTIPVLKTVFKFTDGMPTNLLDDVARDSTKLRFGGPGVIDDVVPDLSPPRPGLPVSNELFAGGVDAPRTTTGTHPEPGSHPEVTPRPNTVTEPGATTAHPQTPTHPEVTPRPNTVTEPVATTAHPQTATHPGATSPAASTHPERLTHEPSTTAHPETPTHPEAPTDPEAATQPQTRSQPEAVTHPESGTEPASSTTHPETVTHPGTATHPDTAVDHAPAATEHAGPGNSAATDLSGHPGEPTTHADDGGQAGHHSEPATDGHGPSEAPDGGPTRHRDGRVYTFEPDGRRRVAGDSLDTYRDKAGRLRDHRGWVSDTNRLGQADLPFNRAEKGTPETASGSDAGTFAQDPGHAERAATLELSHAARDGLSRLVESTGLSPDVLMGRTDDVTRALTHQFEEGNITARQRQALLKALAHDRVAAQMLRDVSERLGDKAAAAVARMRGETMLIDAGGAGAGRFDQVALGDDPPTLRFYEAKGGEAKLGSRIVDGVRHQQGTSEYLDDVLRSDSRLQDSVRQFMAANPDSPITRALQDGTIKVEYDLVQALPGGRIMVTPFVLDPSAFTLPTFN